MAVTTSRVPWLLLVFSLATKHASRRVEVWRRLRRYGAAPLRNSGYLLPNNPANREHFEWLATAIRRYKGEASVVQVHSIDNLGPEQIAQRFSDLRSRDYRGLIRDLQKHLSTPSGKSSAARLSRLRHRYQEIVAIDFFHSPLRERVEELLERADSRNSKQATNTGAPLGPRKSYRGKIWVTRPRPEIDRVASAWLIRRFVDPKARFAFASAPEDVPSAIPFDMFHHGFGHRGEDCTFETLRKLFRVRDRKVGVLAQIVHDADLGDEKFGRLEGLGIEQVLKGWGKQELPDREILAHGFQLIEGLYHSLP